MAKKERLTEVFHKAQEVPFDDDSKFILFSDCHRGDNSSADEFTENHNLFLYALHHYFSNEFIYIEVGDGDDLWENARFEDIRQAHSHVFRQIKEFHDDKRLYLIWGNHDVERQDQKTIETTLFRNFDKYTKKYESLFEGIKLHEGLILNYRGTKKIFLIHGHQEGDLWNGPLLPLNRFLNRYLMKRLRLVGIKNPLSPVDHFSRIKKIEETLKRWAKNNEKTIIAGHTHCYVADPPYFNTGCCVYPHRITGIEIVKGQINLIEWSTKINVKDRTLFADKEVLSGPYPI